MITSGNTVLITGGSTGIGFSLAQTLLDKGNEVIICGRREHRLQEAKTKLPAVHIRVCDVARASDRIALFDWVRRAFPQVNVLINNAGIQRDVDFLADPLDWEATAEEIAINLEAPIHLSSLFLPHLSTMAGAAIVNVSSGLAFTPMSRVPVYCATKAAIHSFSLTLRHQLQPTGVEVFEVIPPAVDSELNYASRVQRGFLKTGVTAEEFASAVVRGLENGEHEIAYGTAQRGSTASRAELDEAFRRMNP